MKLKSILIDCSLHALVFLALTFASMLAAVPYVIGGEIDRL